MWPNLETGPLQMELVMRSRWSQGRTLFQHAWSGVYGKGKCGHRHTHRKNGVWPSRPRPSTVASSQGRPEVASRRPGPWDRPGAELPSQASEGTSPAYLDLGPELRDNVFLLLNTGVLCYSTLATKTPCDGTRGISPPAMAWSELSPKGACIKDLFAGKEMGPLGVL
jgi:hypothetical protein